jgi:CHAD domain-containing protein
MNRPRMSRRDPLQSSAASVIGGYAIRLLRASDAAVTRLADPSDAEALHDARVCLRRLRGWLQAFDSQLKIKRRSRRTLRRLAQATNPARDAEICSQWLAQLRTKLDPSGQPGVTGFLADLGALRDKNYRYIRRELPSAWNRLSRKLLQNASTVKNSRHEKAVFLKAFIASLSEYAGNFDTALERARLHPDAYHIHRSRIAAKKLRYLVEAIMTRHPQSKLLVKELKVLHETAGAIQDLQRFQALSEQVFLRRAGIRYRRLLAMYADSGADHRTLKHPDLTPGLLPLLWISRAACIRQAQYIARFKRNYLSKKRPSCSMHLRQLMLLLTRPTQNR